jgi:hypothetical protein
LTLMVAEGLEALCDSVCLCIHPVHGISYDLCVW